MLAASSAPSGTSATLGHVGQGRVGQAGQDFLELGGQRLLVGLGLGHLGLQTGDLGDQRLGPLTLALGDADRLGGLVAPALQFLQRRLRRAPPLVQLQHGRGHGRQPAAR
jgi:hypothetical protein